MDKPKINRRRSALANFKNRMRGAVGSTRSKKYDKARKDKALRDRIRINRIVADSRTLLNAVDYEAFLTWSVAYTKSFAPTVEQARYQLDELGTFSKKPPLSLEMELSAACSRLAFFQEIISEFREVADRIETAYWASDSGLVYQLLELLENTFGHSVWSIEVNIAFRQLYGGLESQKKYAQSIQSRSQRGIAAYAAYYLSVKNEPTVSASRFAQATERRLNRGKLPISGRIYLNQRIADTWPATSLGLATILQVEQTTSLIDLYETVIKIAQRVLAFGSEPATYQVLREGLKKLSEVRDHRIDKLLVLLGDDRYAFEKPLYQASDAMLRADYDLSWRGSLSEIRSSEVNVNDLILAALCVQHPSVQERSTAIKGTIDRLSIILSKNEFFDRASNELIRICYNLHFLPSVKSLKETCELECFPKSTSLPSLKLRFLNNRRLDIRDLTSGLETAEADLIKRLFANDTAATVRVVESIAERKQIEETVHLDPQFRRIIDTFAELHGTHRDKALTTLLSIARGSNAPRQIRIHLSLELISYLIRDGQVGLAAELAAHEFVQESSIARVLPIEGMVGTDGWRNLRPYSQSISIPIVLDLWWRKTSDDKVATYRRFATQQFLGKNGVERPSQLRDTIENFPRPELIYFLDQVCVYSVLDMLPSFTNSSDLLDERKKIYELLGEIDPTNAERYRDSVLEIKNRQIVQSGLEIVDSSRIHVDEDGISRWAKRELEESFFRYKALVGAGIGTADNFDDILRKIIRREDLDQFLRLPKGEADEILVGIITLLLDRFLLDSSYGLDSYLSQRIRHGSLMNYLRSPVEQARLVTQKSSQTGAYQPNIFWIEKIDAAQEDESKQIQSAFLSFSQEFDGIILELKDRYLNVASKEKPHGLFSIEVNTSAFYLVRSLMPEISSIEELVQICIRFFWGLLEPTLKTARDFLTGATKRRFSLVFETLRSQVARVDSTQTLAELSTAIGDASASVQSELDKIAGWLEKQEAREIKNTYTLEQATEIAIESVLSAHKTFKPDISVNVETDASVSVGTMVLLADAMRVLLGNVDAHADTKKPPKVSIKIEIDENHEKLTIRCASEVRRGIRTSVVEEHLRGIRKQISDGSVLNLRTEGGSGLKRLAHLVGNSKDSRLEFGFAGDELFFVEMTVPIFTIERQT